MPDLDAEYQAAPMERRLDDAEFDRMNTLGKEEIASLPDEKRKDFLATAKYHNQTRMGMDSIEGIIVGDKSIDELGI